MKINCRSCHETFDIPDGKGITRAVCPFGEHTNDLCAPSVPASAVPRTGRGVLSSTPTCVPVARHPLAPQFWILAICALVVTANICLSFLFTVISMV